MNITITEVFAIAIGLLVWAYFVRLLISLMTSANDESRRADEILDDIGLPMRAGIRERRNSDRNIFVDAYEETDRGARHTDISEVAR